MLAVFLDIEANGLNFFVHRSLEIAFRIIDLYDGREVDAYAEVISQPKEIWESSDLSSLKVNGFTWEKVCRGKEEKEVSENIKAMFEKHHIKRGKAVFICQNPSFDRAFFSQIISPSLQETLQFPYHWLDFASMFFAVKMKEKAQGPYPWEIGFSKNIIAKKMELPKESYPHLAMNGVDHLILLYQNLIGFPLEVKKESKPSSQIS